METFKRDIDPNRVFRFRFKAPRMSDRLAHFVLSDDIDKMESFLKQHNFDMALVDIEILPAEKYFAYDDHMLTEYQLKSNYSDYIYKIYTTEQLVCDCSQFVSSLISNSLIFHTDQIIRSDVPLMTFISEMVDKLDHVYVLDHTLCDQDGKPYSSNYERYTKVGFPSDSKIGNKELLYSDETSYDDSAICESIGSHINTYTPLPFTLEAYISFFTSILTDSYM